jgi:hypothetical protein
MSTWQTMPRVQRRLQTQGEPMSTGHVTSQCAAQHGMLMHRLDTHRVHCMHSVQNVCTCCSSLSVIWRQVRLQDVVHGGLNMVHSPVYSRSAVFASRCLLNLCTIVQLSMQCNAVDCAWQAFNCKACLYTAAAHSCQAALPA